MSHSIHTTARRMLQDVTNTPCAPARKKSSRPADPPPRVKDRAAEIEALPSEVRTAVFPPAWRAALESASDESSAPKRGANAIRQPRRLAAVVAIIVAVAFATIYLSRLPLDADATGTSAIAPALDDAQIFVRERPIAEERVMVVDETGSQKIALAILWPGEDALSAAQRFCTAHIITHEGCPAAVADRLVEAAMRAANNGTRQP